MNRQDIAAKWILVTGASSGLGKEIALDLALRRHSNLLLVARRSDRLREVKAEIERQSDVLVELYACDLTREAETQAAISWAMEHDDLAGAVLNAGVTFYGKHTEMPLATCQNLVNLNVQATATMATELVQHWQAQQFAGRLMLVSSLGGHVPLPYQALYSGSKAFISSFGLALAEELRHGQQSVTVFSPGGISTEMIEKSGLNKLPGGKLFNRSATKCANVAVNAFLRRSMLASSSWGNYLLLYLGKAVPYRLSNFFLRWLYGSGLQSK